MTNTKNDWLGAGAISAAVVVLGAAFFWATSNYAEQPPMGWMRLLVLRLLVAVVVWAIAIFSNRRRLGLRICFELGILLLSGFAAIGLGHIFGDGRVAPMLAALGLSHLSTAMFLGGGCISAVAVDVAVRLVRFQAILQRSRAA